MHLVGATPCRNVIIISNHETDFMVAHHVVRRCQIEFEGMDIEGELIKPQGAFLLERKKASFNPLIQLRSDFNIEMKQSVLDIQ